MLIIIYLLFFLVSLCKYLVQPCISLSSVSALSLCSIFSLLVSKCYTIWVLISFLTEDMCQNIFKNQMLFSGFIINVQFCHSMSEEFFRPFFLCDVIHFQCVAMNKSVFMSVLWPLVKKTHLDFPFGCLIYYVLDFMDVAIMLIWYLVIDR